MTVRGDILDLITNPFMTYMERIRIVQTLGLLGHTSPFTVPRFQGDSGNESTELRRWINLQGVPIGGWGYQTQDYYDWVSECPFKKELGEVWSDKPIWGLKTAKWGEDV